MDIYYRWETNFLRGYGPPTTREAASHLSAYATRLGYSIILSIPKWPATGKEELLRLLTVDSLWAICIVFAGWVLATIFGGPLAVIINLLLIGYGLSALWGELKGITDEGMAWLRQAHDAKNEAELREAGDHFALALSGTLMNAIQILLTHRLLKGIETKVKRRYPPPAEFERELKKARAAESDRVKAAEKDRLRKAADKVGKVAEVVFSGSRGKGMQEAADDFPTAAVAVAGTVIAAGVIYLGVSALSGDNK